MSEAIDTAKSESSGGVGQFVKDTREELNKVSFPSSDDVRGTTMIVVINVIFFAIFLWVVDHLWAYILDGLTWLVSKIFGY